MMRFLVLQCAYVLVCSFCGFRGSIYNVISGRTCQSKPPLMSLSTVPPIQFNKLVPNNVTPDQWRSYWGVNKTDRLQRVLESVLIAYGGAWLSWFLSFMAGGTVSSIVGTLLVFNWMYTPWFAAKRNNENIRFQKGGTRPLKHALYVGRIARIERARRRMPGTVTAVVSQNFLVLGIADDEDRVLEIVTPWRDNYNQLRVGMTYETIIASTQADFSLVCALTDGYTPACNVWIGDYPYLHKKRFRKYVLTAASDEIRSSGGSPDQRAHYPDSTSSEPVTAQDESVASVSLYIADMIGSESESGDEYDGSSY